MAIAFLYLPFIVCDVVFALVGSAAVTKDPEIFTGPDNIVFVLFLFLTCSSLLAVG